MSQIDNLGWPIREAADRAVQAVHGLFVLSVDPEEARSLIEDYTTASYSSIELIHRSEDAENAPHFEQAKLVFESILRAKRPHWLRSGKEGRIWRLFLERYDIRTMQLRANVRDVLDCFDLDVTTALFNERPQYLLRVPRSTEVVVCPWNTGLKMDMVIPPRLLLLDMFLMLSHASDCHDALTKRRLANELQCDADLGAHARMDAYVRQVLILGATVCEAVLQDYGHLVLALCSGSPHAASLEELHKRGLTARLNRCPHEWPVALGHPTPVQSKAIHDMIALTQFRNRLVHYDGRVNCWHAFHLNLNNPAWGFSDRISPFADAAAYGLPQTFVGHEWGLAEFCVNTVVDTIDALHRLVFPDDPCAVWIKLPRSTDGRIDLAAIAASEHHARTA